MNSRLRAILRRLAGPYVGHLWSIRDRAGNRSWSQEGEDRILLRYFGLRHDGFYVDVGAHHPYRYSNTALLHRLGWRGINIDAMPGSMAQFRLHRPRDINLEIGISDQEGTSRFYVFDEPALNTFDADIAHGHQGGTYKLTATVDVRLRPLGDVLQEHAQGREIDLLSVDAEGHDLAVLRSNDWSRFRPRVVLAESVGSTIGTVHDDACAQLLTAAGYLPYAKTVNTVMYIDTSRDDAVTARQSR